MNWGSVPDWLAAIAALIGALGTIFILWQGLQQFKQAEADKRSAQARLVNVVTRGPARLILAGYTFSAEAADGEQSDHRCTPVQRQAGQFVAQMNLGVQRVEVMNNSQDIVPFFFVTLTDETQAPNTPQENPAGAFTMQSEPLTPNEKRPIDLIFDVDDLEAFSGEFFTPLLSFYDGNGHKWKRTSGEAPVEFFGNF